MGQMILTAQQWLNATYRGKTDWHLITEIGRTDWANITAYLVVKPRH